MKNVYGEYVFGTFRETEVPLDAAGARELVERARKETRRAAATPLSTVLDILDDCGRSWADPEYPLRDEAQRELEHLIPFSREMIAQTLALLPSVLSRSELEARIRAELGPLALLDGFVHDPDFAGSHSMRPRGVLLHVAAGNVFLGCVDSLVMGLITKNVNILKLSRSDPYFPLAFVRSLAEHDREKDVCRSIAVVSWKGGDQSVESVLKSGADTIMVWGGEGSVRAYREGLGISTRLVEYGPKVSTAIVTRESLTEGRRTRLAMGLARDMVMWDQSACSSPQTVYIQDMDTPGSGVNALVPSLLSALETLSIDLPLGRLSIDEKVEIRKERERARFAMAQGEGQVWESKPAMNYTVIHRPSPGFCLSPLNRTLFLRSFQRIEEVFSELTPIRQYLQCVACDAPPEVMAQIALRLADLGANRITAVGKMSAVKTGAPHDGRYPLAELVRRVSLEIDRPVVSVPDRLKTVLTHAAAHSPFYSRRLAGVDLKSPGALENLPLLSKDDLYRNTPPMGSGLVTGPIHGAVVFASGGSTGHPKFSYYANSEWKRVCDVLASILSAGGVSTGDRVANLFVAGGLWSSFVAVNRALEKLGCLSLPIGGHSEIDLIITYLETFDANVVIGLPSMLMALAQTIKEKGRGRIRIEKVLYGGERISDACRETLHEALGAPLVRSAGYASVDAGTIGYQCQRAAGTVHHVCEGHQLVEILDPDSGSPVNGENTGELVVTSLERFLMPLIRYRTGDLARWVTDPCGCGGNDRRFELLGRCDDILHIGGARVTVADVETALQSVPGLSTVFQIELSLEGNDERLTVRVELEKAGTRGLATLKKTVQNVILKVCADLRFSIEKGWLKPFTVDLVPPGSIPRLARTGKRKSVVDRRGRSEGSR